MCGGFVSNTWRGVGKTWQRLVGAGVKVISAAMKSRWMPFRDEPMAQTIMGLSGQNQSGSSWENEHAGLRNEGVNLSGQGSMGNSKPSS